MAARIKPGHAQERIHEQIRLISRLRGTGPNPFEYDQWDSRTEEILVDVFGRDSAEVGRYREAAGTRGRLPGVRGQAEDMTLNIHGQWGILGRLERAEVVLRDIASRLGP